MSLAAWTLIATALGVVQLSRYALSMLIYYGIVEGIVEWKNGYAIIVGVKGLISRKRMIGAVNMAVRVGSNTLRNVRNAAYGFRDMTQTRIVNSAEVSGLEK